MEGLHKSYKTSELAKIGQVHPNTVRFYEKWGLLSTAKREENGYRIFNERHVIQLKIARCVMGGA